MESRSPKEPRSPKNFKISLVVKEPGFKDFTGAVIKEESEPSKTTNHIKSNFTKSIDLKSSMYSELDSGPTTSMQNVSKSSVKN